MRNTERGHDWNPIYSSVETTDWHELEKEHFADRIATTINKAAESGEMKEMALIALLVDMVPFRSPRGSWR
jgi:protein required for attachment to host cells